MTGAKRNVLDEPLVRRHRTGAMARLSRNASRKVLVAVDCSDERALVVRVLKGAGYQVFACDCYERAMQIRDHHQPGVLLSDLILHDGRGAELVREWKRVDPTLPVLVLTEPSHSEYVMQAFDAGADDVVRKPIGGQELIKRIDVHSRTLDNTEQLRRALTELDRLRLYSAEAAALLAHDLNNGLTVAQTNLFLISQEVGGDSDTQETADSAQRVLRRMSTLVRNFVDIARSEDGALQPTLQRIDVAELIRQAASVHHVRTADGHGPIEVLAPPSYFSRVDGILLERVLHNLLINATRYVDVGGRVRVELRQEVTARGRETVMEVSNSGPVIPERLRRGLFDKYRKGDDARAQTGMGLYFCRLACEAHGGTISLVDVPGLATTFRIRLPHAATE